MRGFNNNCSDLAGVVLVFWVDGGLWEIYDHFVASQRTSSPRFTRPNRRACSQANLQEVVTIRSLTVFTENIS